MIKLEYYSKYISSLSDEDWDDLEKAGWIIDKFISSHNQTYIGGASKVFETPNDGVKEWQQITAKDPWDDCEYCGSNHEFYYTDAKGLKHYPILEKKTVLTGWK